MSLEAAVAREIVFVDTAIDRPAALAAGVRPEIEVVMLDATGDELAQVSSTLRDRHDLTALHIVSHGAPGAMVLGHQTIDGSVLRERAKLVQGWRSSFVPSAEILVYGCEVARGSTGAAWVDALAELTGVNVAASTDRTGSAALGGNWTLEAHSNLKVATPAPFVAGFVYDGVLPTTQAVDSGFAIFVRPGGTSYTWTFRNGQYPVDNQYHPITSFAFQNIPVFTWNLTRGHIEYSTNSGSSWTTYPITTSPSNLNFIATGSTVWRFVDTTPADSTTTNSVGTAWIMSSVTNNATTTGSTVIPDNAPTDITSDHRGVFFTAAQGSDVATLTPVDTGSTLGGYWVITSQSVPNLFTLSFDNTKGNTATLKIGTGTIPALGQVPTVTVRYNDIYQTDGSGNPSAGQGFTKTLSFTVVSETSNDLSLGNDVALNTYTTDVQSSPALASLSTGNLVAVWQSTGQGKSSSSFAGIYGQVLSSAGVKVGSEFTVSNAGTSISESYPTIAALASGRYVVAYVTFTSVSRIGFRLVAANGTVGSELIANTSAGANNPSVATLTDGSFAITWSNDAGDICLRRFNASDGSAVAAETLIVNHATATGYYPSVAALSNGNYAVAWTDGAASHVKVAVTSGSAVDTGIVLSGYGPPRVAGLTGGFVVASESYDSVALQSNVDAVRYDNSAVIQGSRFRVHTGTVGDRYEVSVATLSGGGFVVAWASSYDDYDLGGISGRRFAANGTAVDGSDFEINQHRTGDQSFPALAPISGDLFAAVWTITPAAQIAATTYFSDIVGRMLLPVVSNVAPTFVGSTTTLPVNQNASATDVKGLLHVSDSDASQTETWSQSSGPTHGTLTITSATASTGTGSTDITPGGTITYAPAAGYFGSDSFAIQVSDGTASAIRTITVTVSDVTKPTVLSVVRQTPSTQSLTTATTTMTFRVTYSETVTGVVAANFQIENINGGTITGTIGTPTGSTNVYDVPVTLTGGSGEFRLKVVN